MKRLVAVAITAFAVIVPAAQGAVGPPGSLVPATETFAGRSYAQWLTAGWQWQLAHGHLQTEAPKQAAAVPAAGQAQACGSCRMPTKARPR